MIKPAIITGVVRRTISKGVTPAMPDTAMTTPTMGDMVRARPAESWTGTTRGRAGMPTLAAASGSRG